MCGWLKILSNFLNCQENYHCFVVFLQSIFRKSELEKLDSQVNLNSLEGLKLCIF